MTLAPLFLVLALGADKPASNSAITPVKLLANLNETLARDQPVLVRFQVVSVGTQPVYDVASKTTSTRIILYSPAYDANKHASFDVALFPEAQAALKRVGITDFAKHFTGKQIEVRGPLSCFSTILYGSPAEWDYYLDVKSLDQFRAVN